MLTAKSRTQRLKRRHFCGSSCRFLHRFERSSRRWSSPRCPLSRTAAAHSSDPSERSGQSGTTEQEIIENQWKGGSDRAVCDGIILFQNSRQQNRDLQHALYPWVLLSSVNNWWQRQHFGWTWLTHLNDGCNWDPATLECAAGNFRAVL